MTMFHRRVGGFCVVLILLALILSPVPGFAAEKAKPAKAEAKAPAPQAQPSTDKSDDLPPPELTLGTRAGEGVVEGYGDILAPILALKSGIVFVNPRATYNDHSAEEYNLGVGYRHLLREKGMILGANVYYDYRETESGGRFNQVGFGLEYLSDWVDARANYYLPENHTETVETEVTTTTDSDTQYTKWGNPFAEGNNIYQNGTFYKGVTTTEITQHFIQYEEAMEGFDMELGVRLPIPTVMDYADVKVFGGFYHYNRDFGLEDLNGFKGRVEIRAMPSLYLDAEFFENKELTGRDFYLGARVSVPFDVANISKGRNPFAGAIDGMKFQKQKTTIASRLTEMVIRDLHVQTEFSEATEEVSNRTAVSTTLISVTQKVSSTLATDVIFVNQDTGNDANPGTIELPVQQIPTGIAKGSNVFVMATVGPYLVNLQIGKNVNLMGQGFPIGNDGKYLNGDSRYAVIKGAPPVFGDVSGGGPTIFVDGYGNVAEGIDPTPGLAEDVKIRGFDIQSYLDAGSSVQGASTVPLLSSIAVAVDSVQNFELAYNKLNNAAIGLGAIYDDEPAFNLNVHNNTFDTLGLGAGVIAINSQGGLTFSKNTIQNTLVGLVGVAVGAGPDPLSPILEPELPTVLNAQITDNIVKGGGLGIDVLPTLQLGSVNVLDLLPLEAGALAVKNVAVDPASLPSLSALNVAAVDFSDNGPAVVNATITGNVIEDNLLGIGVVGGGENAVVNANIQNNTLRGGGLAAILGGTGVSGLAADDTIDGSLLGIWMLGADYATLDNAIIANNTITDHALGIGVLGLYDANMNNGQIVNNTISDSLLGIVVAGYSETDILLKKIDLDSGVHMNNWTINANRISGNGVFQIADLVLSIIPTNIIPEVINTAIQQIALPDTGIAGILVAGITAGNSTLGAGVESALPTADLEMNGYTIAGNVISNEILGIGVVGVGVDISPFKGIGPFLTTQMNDYKIYGNTLEHNAIGIGIVGAEMAEMVDYEITQNVIKDSMVGVVGASVWGSDLSGLWVHNNSIIGGDLDDLATALAPIANTNVIPDQEIVDLLKMPLPDTGAIGVLVADIDADMYDVTIENNAINKNLVGVLAVGVDYADMDGLIVKNNTINDSVLGIGLMAFGDETEMSDCAIQGNVINDPAIGIMALASGWSWMDNLTISGNTINRGLIGVMAASWDDADMLNLVISGNTISGANNPAKVGLLTAFLDFTDLTWDIEDVINQEWNPALFPNSGLLGVVVSPDGAGETSVLLSGNRFSNEAQAGLVYLENMPVPVPISYQNNISSDGRFYVQGSTYVLTQSGNVPSPVVELP